LVLRLRGGAHRVVNPRRREEGQLPSRKPKIDRRKAFGRKWSAVG
jgi:hypothetical protein